MEVAAVHNEQANRDRLPGKLVLRNSYFKLKRKKNACRRGQGRDGARARSRCAMPNFSMDAVRCSGMQHDKQD